MTTLPLKNKKKTRLTSSDVPDTWTVRGVPPEARTAALVASRRAGLTMGEWVTRAVQEHAKTAAAVPSISTEDTLTAILSQLEKRDQAIADLAVQVADLRRGFLTRLFGR